MRVELSTLIGLDDHPGQVAGSGPVHAFFAREIVAGQARGRWRYAVTDDHGCLIDDGVLRARPTKMLHSAPPVTSAIVEIAIPRTLLDELRADPAKAKTWAPVVSDIHRQTRKHQHRERRDRRNEPHNDPRRRTPSAGLRRHLEVRDRGCVAPGCRMPATTCDIDHRIDHATGGPTTAENLQPLCRHDHRLKHDGGWTITRRPNGTYRWRTPNGLTFDTRPAPIILDLPPPHPRR